MEAYKYLIVLSLFITSIVACDVVSDQEVEPTGPTEEETRLRTLDEENMVEPPSDSAQLAQKLHGDVSKTWSTVAFTIEGMDGLLDCRLDDIMVLSADGTYRFNSNGTRCGMEDAETKAGVWSFDEEALTLTFDDGFTASISSLTDSQIVLSGVYSNRLIGDFDIVGSFETK